MRPQVLMVAAAVAGLLSLTGCSSGTEPAAADSTTPDSTQSTSSPSSSPAPTADEWTDEASARAGFVAFTSQVESADGYLVSRRERTTAEGQYFGPTILTTVDVAHQVASSTQSFDVCDNTLWAQIAPGKTVSEAKDFRLTVISDFTTNPARQLMTYPSEPAWAGKWLRIDSAAVSDGSDLGDVTAEALATADLEDFAFPVAALGELEPSSFSELSHSLEYDVPIEVARAWLPTGLVTTLLNAGLDVSSLTTSIPARVSFVDGGVEALAELTPLLQEAATLIDDPDVISYLQQVGMPVAVRIDSLGSVEPIELPAPETIVTDPLVSE